jgi:hypothetical protein
MAVPNTFATDSGFIPLADLDANFSYYDAALNIVGSNVTTLGAVTINTGTANGVAYLNGSKVLTTGSALTFDGSAFQAPTLNITGTANFASNVYLTTNATYYQSRTTGGTYIRMLGISSGNTAYVGPIDAGPVDMIVNASSSSANIQFYTSGSERARITSSGSFFVGVTSEGGNANGVTLNASTGYQVIQHASGTTSSTRYSYFYYDGGEIGSITQNGTTGVLYNITSDQRLKENIVDAPAASSLIDDIQVRSFDWKSDGSHQRYGFIAQELVAVAPEAVHQPVNPDEMMGVDYSKLVPMLVKEIQSLRQRVAQLEGKS